MTLLEELRLETANAIESQRYGELSKADLANSEALGELRVAMLSAAKEGCHSITVPIEEVANKKWESTYSKDYRSNSKRRFDQALSEFLTLHFEGVSVKAVGKKVNFSWW